MANMGDMRFVGAGNGARLNRVGDWNQRYAMYCRAHGETPHRMLEIDRKRWPGDSISGYMAWVEERWQEWDAANGHASRANHDALDHSAFNAWLERQYGDDAA